MKTVCDRYGVLLIYDEIMCGMGRTGTLHAWQDEGVVPDIEVVGKSLGAGYVPISAVLVNERVVTALQGGSKYFKHGQTYQSHPLACAAALEVQRIVQNQNLVQNVRQMGNYLETLLRERLADHPNVGDIRGRGLFWAIEFVADKETKEPLDPVFKVAERLHDKGMKPGYDIALFHATGSANSGWGGDHVLLAPPYIVDRSDIEEIVDRAAKVVEDVFEELPLGAGRATILKKKEVECAHIEGKRLPNGIPRAFNTQEL